MSEELLDAAAVEAELRKANAFRNAGNYDQAQALYENLLSRFPDYVGALYALALVYIERGDYAKALPCLVQAAMYNPADFRIMTNLAGVYLKLDAVELAAQTYERALALNPEVPEIHLNDVAAALADDLATIERPERTITKRLSALLRYQVIQLPNLNFGIVRGAGY